MDVGAPDSDMSEAGNIRARTSFLRVFEVSVDIEIDEMLFL